MKIKFYIAPYKGPLNANYQHNIICLAEGFRQLKIEFYGNIDYWYLEDQKNYLIKKASSNYHSNIDIYSTQYVKTNSIIKNYNHFDTIKIIVDTEDGLETISSNKFVLNYFNVVLRCHYNDNFNYSKKVYPWAFGLSKRILIELQKSENLYPQEQVLNNFRVPHNLRKLGIDELTPILSKKYKMLNYITDNLDKISDGNRLSLWSQTGRRHNSEYFKQLNESALTYTFGGIINLKPVKQDFLSKFVRQYYRLLASINSNKKISHQFIYQFDSWRFWEAMASNTCPIHVNFNSWALKFPVMPENKIHYWGINKLNFKESAMELIKMTDTEIISIGKAGEKWAIENYSPIATTNRLIELVNKIN